MNSGENHTPQFYGWFSLSPGSANVGLCRWLNFTQYDDSCFTLFLAPPVSATQHIPPGPYDGRQRDRRWVLDLRLRVSEVITGGASHIPPSPFSHDYHVFWRSQLLNAVSTPSNTTFLLTITCLPSAVYVGMLSMLLVS